MRNGTNQNLAAPAGAANGIEYRVIDVRMTRRGEEQRKTGSQELAEKLTVAARDGWRLERLQFHNLPQGDGYNDLVTAYAVMVRGKAPDGLVELIEATEKLLAHRECPVHSPEAAAIRACISRIKAVR